MAQKLYKVVETSWAAGRRVETDIGCKAKPEQAAKAELRELKLKHPGRVLSLSKQA